MDYTRILSPGLWTSRTSGIIRLAVKGSIGIPQHFLQAKVQAGLARLEKKARQRGAETHDGRTIL